jgi:hypothetical protein
MKQFLYEFLCNRLCTDVVAYVIKPFLKQIDNKNKVKQIENRVKTIEDYEYEFEAQLRGRKRWRKYTE